MFNSVVSPSLQNCSSTGAAAKKVPQFQPPPHVNKAFFSTDDFRMYGFKISKCPRNRSHDWTNCPYAHHGERARRRDPVKVPYLAIACPEFRNNEGRCPRGEGCVFAHGIFEYWLHPDKYRTRPCTLGLCCQSKVCFFAHGREEVRPEIRYHFHRTLPVGDGAPSVESDGCGIIGSLIVPESGYTTEPRPISAAPVVELEYANSQEVIGYDFFSKSSAQLVEEEGENNSRELGYDFLESSREMTVGELGGDRGEGSGGSNNLEDDQVSPDLPGLEWVWELLK